METEKLKKLIGNAHIKERIKYLSYGVNEKEASENELWLTIWKVGYINVSWTKKGFQPYPDAFLKEIREIIRLPLVNVWDHFDREYMDGYGSIHGKWTRPSMKSYLNK